VELEGGLPSLFYDKADDKSLDKAVVKCKSQVVMIYNVNE